VALDNMVIVTGRGNFGLDAPKRNSQASTQCKAMPGDEAAISTLHSDVVRDFLSLNVLVNDAGIVGKINLHKSASDLKGLKPLADPDMNLSIHPAPDRQCSLRALF
jgi:short-subunit dehydrogenase involved in D-alanine esterification of teichoic acids